jgi:peptidoglycan/xylan/chitin deacetylase (PgdA/CDA1 family)
MRKLKMKRHLSLSALILLANFAPAQSLERFNQLEMRLKTETIRIAYPTAEAAKHAKLTIAPLPDAKKLAFTARWDDNRPRDITMRDVMARHGYKAGFYLNGGRGKAESVSLAQELMKKGCAVCLHSMTHPRLTLLPLNEVFWEILAIKVERESDSDSPSVAFGFPYCDFRNSVYAHAHRDIGESLIRSGIHFVAQASFLAPSSAVYPETFSVAALVYPGDVLAKPERFDAEVAKVLSNEKYLKQNPVISLAYHVRHSEEGFENLEKSLKKYGYKRDWWYCEPNEYAAYRYRFHNSRISLRSIDECVAEYQISTPVDADAGRTIPLTLMITGAKPKRIWNGNEDVCWRQTKGIPNFRIFAKADDSKPTKIDMVDNPKNTAFSQSISSRFNKFKGLVFHLRYVPARNAAILTASNQTAEPVSNVNVVLRLPLLFVDGIQKVDFNDLPAHADVTREIPLGRLHEGPDYREGAPYLVAQMDFTHQSVRGRIYATCRGTRSVSSQACPRDTALIHGPFEAARATELLALSQPETPLQLVVPGDATKGWCHFPEANRLKLKSDCLAMDLTREQRSSLNQFADKNEKGIMAIALSFKPGETTDSVTLDWPGWGRDKLKTIFLNGKAYPGDCKALPARAGKVNRLIVVPAESAARISRYNLLYPGVRMIPKVDWLETATVNQ